jgi:hypothetical protein
MTLAGCLSLLRETPMTARVRGLNMVFKSIKTSKAEFPLSWREPAMSSARPGINGRGIARERATE